MNMNEIAIRHYQLCLLLPVVALAGCGNVANRDIDANRGIDASRDIDANRDIDAGRDIDASLKRFTVTVTFPGTGGGTVTATPGTLSCPTSATCRIPIEEGTQLTLAAVAQNGSVFLGWSSPQCPGTGPCTMMINSDQDVTATFGLNLSLQVTKTGSGTGTVKSAPAGIDCGPDCNNIYLAGTKITLDATADPDSHFVGWTGCTGAGTSCTVTVDTAVQVTARFDHCALTIRRQGTGGGTVTSNPAGISCGADCTKEFACGTTVQLAAAAAARSTFVGWSNGCTGTGLCFVTPATSTTIDAAFLQCGGIGQPCCAAGPANPACDAHSYCRTSTNTCTGCPATSILKTQFSSTGSDCNGINIVIPFPGRCTSGMFRARCEATAINPPGGASCAFESWFNPSDQGDCNCNVRFITPRDCSKHVDCSITITQTSNPPNPPDLAYPDVCP